MRVLRAEVEDEDCVEDGVWRRWNVAIGNSICLRHSRGSSLRIYRAILKDIVLEKFEYFLILSLSIILARDSADLGAIFVMVEVKLDD